MGNVFFGLLPWLRMSGKFASWHFSLSYASSSSGRTPQVPLAVESSSPATQQEISQRSGDAASSCSYVIVWLVQKVDFLKEVLVVVSVSLWRSTSKFLPGKVV